MRAWPSAVTHSRPAPPESSGEPPGVTPVGSRELVNVISALTPPTGAAVSAWWIASASDAGAGVGPEPIELATATPVPSATMAAHNSSRRDRGRRRRTFIASYQYAPR